MVAKIMLYSQKHGEINKFLGKFYTSNLGLEDQTSWQKDFSNPIDISELIAAFIDNDYFDNITMWVSLDEDVFIRISHKNAENIIKYLFERYPY